MEPEAYLTPPGLIVSANTLGIPKALDVALAVQASEYARLIECHRGAGTLAEVVVFEVEVELGQKRENDIRRIERIAVEFTPTDETYPRVMSLRADFPKVPHLMLGESELPRCFCLYEQDYAEVKLGWSATGFIERIRDWLARTAKGTLHEHDQALEPLLLGTDGTLVIPFDLVTHPQAGSRQYLRLYKVDSPNGPLVLRADQTDGAQASNDGRTHVATWIYGAPQPHGIIARQPRKLSDLHEFCTSAGIDLAGELRQCLRDWCTEGSIGQVVNSKLILILVLPKTRGNVPTVEASDVWAFMFSKTIGQLGVDIGVWDLYEGEIGLNLTVREEMTGGEVALCVLRPVASLSRSFASQLNGLNTVNDSRITMVGVGALGSQVFHILTRMGYGTWTLIDDDILLPHNVARHALPGSFIGLPKATALAMIANDPIKDQSIAQAIVANALHPKTSRESVSAALKQASVILDASASVATARYLSRDVDSGARRVSVFLNPSGNDVVMLAEGADRKTPLDYLEMLYYRHLVTDWGMDDHLRPQGSPVRYANSCRDVSQVMPQDLIALHAAICARAIRSVLESPKSAIALWRAHPGGGVEARWAEPECMSRIGVGTWTILTDEWLTRKIFEEREARLPNETGGVLVGAFDLSRRIVYVVDAISSPPDSKEWPTNYIRGCQGLRQQVEKVRESTLGMLQYVGEWHSHPNGLGSDPSPDDEKAMAWLAGHMGVDGFPAVMLIAAEHTYGFHLRGRI